MNLAHHGEPAASASTAEWISAYATLAGVVAAIAAGFFAYRALRRERLRDEAREEAERSAQAARVAAWPETLPAMPDEGFSADPDVVLDHRWWVLVRNASELPVFRVRLTWYEGEHILGGHQMILALSPSTRPRPIAVPQHVLPEWKTKWGNGGTRPVAPVDRIGVAVEFTDAAGIVWQRDSPGKLTQVHRGDGATRAPGWKS